MTTTMNLMPILAPEITHLYSHVEVDGFTFQDPQTSLDFDFENDEDAARDIDDFTSFLANVDDEETARDVDDFATLMHALSKGSDKDAELSDISLEDLLNGSDGSDKLDVNVSHKDDVDMSDASESDSEDDEEAYEVIAASRTSTPFHFLAPIDPRCVIQTPVFKTLDARIPTVNIPKMDVSFDRVVSTPLKTRDLTSSVASPPTSPGRRSVSSYEDGESNGAYVHDADKCWVCKSNKSEERKRVLHRFVEKRYRRNWKRGARYTARSRVASSRVREGGRFVTKCEWVAVAYD